MRNKNHLCWAGIMMVMLIAASTLRAATASGSDQGVADTVPEPGCLASLAEYGSRHCLQQLLREPLSDDPSGRARGQRLADEACAAAGTGRRCRFSLKESGLDIVFYDSKTSRLTTTTHVLDTFPDDDELRALFLWSVIFTDSGRYQKAMLMEDSLTSSIEMAAEFFFSLFENPGNIESLEDLALFFVFIGATGVVLVAVVNAEIFAYEMSIYGLCIYNDDDVLEALAAAGYDPDAFLSILRKVDAMRADRSEGEKEKLIAEGRHGDRLKITRLSMLSPGRDRQ